MGRKPGAPRSPERRRGRSQQGRLLTALEQTARSTKARRVECATLCILFTAVLAIFTRLRAQRARLPHDLRLNNYLSPPVHHHFHIVHVVVDDLGWGDVGWRADSAGLADGVDTPVLDSLRTQGVTLRQFYTPKDCAPSRASTLTGRWPFRVGYYGNPGDDGGVPSEFEFMPQMLHRRFGFQCHHIGKWHLGFKKESWTPTHRGFLTSIGFYHWGEDYESHLFPPEYAVGRNQGCRGYDMVNATSALWEQSLLEASSSSSSSSSSHASTKGGKFRGVGPELQGVSSAALYGQEALLRMANHPMDLPLYLFLAPQHVHDPYGDGTENTLADRREKYKVLVSEFDGLVGTVVGGLKKYGFWEHTLLLVHTDNGGEMVFSDACASAAAWARVQSSSASLSSSLSSSLSTSSAENKDEVGEELASDKAGAETAAGQEETGVRAKEAGEARIAAAPSGVGFRGGAASNGALRGGKFTLWQGGVRGVAMLAGGAIPIERRGHSFDGLIHVVDLWASFAFLSHALGQLHHHKHTHVPAGANNAAHTTTTTASSSPAGDQQSHGRRTTADALGSDSSSSSSSDGSSSGGTSSSGTTRDQPTRSTVTAPVGDTAETAAAAAAVSTGDRRVWVSSSAAALEWAARGYPETSTSGADSVASLAAAVLPPDSKFLARWLALRPDRPGPGGVMAATAGLSSSSSSGEAGTSSSGSSSTGGSSFSSSSGTSGASSHSRSSSSSGEDSQADKGEGSPPPLVGAAGAFEALFHPINGGGSDFTHLSDLAFQRSGLLSYAHRRPPVAASAGGGVRKKTAGHSSSSSSSRGGDEEEGKEGAGGEEVDGEEGEGDGEESGGFFGDLEEGFGEVWGMVGWEDAAFAASEVMADSALDWLGYSVDQRDSHLAAILASPLERNEILLQPLNEHSNGSICAPSLLKSPFKPSCASGLIVWPYKLLMGYPGDPRHLSWPASNRNLPPDVAQTVSESTVLSDARRIAIIAELEALSAEEHAEAIAPGSSKADLETSEGDRSSWSSSRSRRTSKSSSASSSSEDIAYDWHRTISGDPVCAYLDPSNALEDSEESDFLLPGRRRNQGARFKRPRAANNNSEFLLREARREEQGLERGRRNYFRRRRGGGRGNSDAAGSSTRHDGRRLAMAGGAAAVAGDATADGAMNGPPSSKRGPLDDGNDAHRHLCSAAKPCLFDLAQDPYELNDLLGSSHARRDASAGLLDQSGRPMASRYSATLSAMQQRLMVMSSQGPPPVSSSGDNDAFPAEACARVQATGTWLPWEE